MIDALLRHFAEHDLSAPRGDSPSARTERPLAAVVELVFGLFLLSGMGFAYLGLRAVGWAVLLLRLALLYVGVLGMGNVSPAFGLFTALVLWGLVPVALAFVVSRSGQRPGPVDEGRGADAAGLEGLGYWGLGGIGWIAAGRRAMGLTILVVRALLLGTIIFPWMLFAIGAADICVNDDPACVVARTGVLLWFVFWLALWLAFPATSAALLRRARELGRANDRTEGS